MTPSARIERRYVNSGAVQSLAATDRQLCSCTCYQINQINPSDYHHTPTPPPIIEIPPLSMNYDDIGLCKAWHLLRTMTSEGGILD